jgi:hypothetical protein
MGTQVMLDNDVMKALLNKAIDNKDVVAVLCETIDSGKLSHLVNGALRPFLGLENKGVDVNNNYPSSNVQKVQALLDGLRNTIFNISEDGMKCSNRGKWVAHPNTITIKVQDSRARNLRITIYGNPEEFSGVKGLLNIERDMASYSRFLLNDENELPSAIKIIQYSYELKKDRGRL